MNPDVSLHEEACSNKASEHNSLWQQGQLCECMTYVCINVFPWKNKHFYSIYKNVCFNEYKIFFALNLINVYS